MKRVLKLVFAVLIAACAGACALAQTQRKSLAIFVRNDSPNYAQALDANKKNLENILASYVNDSGFSVISQDLVLRNLNDYLGNDNAKYRQLAESIRDCISSGNKLDLDLFANASGLRLAEMIGADYILVASISSFSERKKISDLYGVKTVNHIYTLRCNYNLCEGGMGLGTAGKSVKSEKMLRQTADAATEIDEELFNELMDDCASQMASSLASNLSENKIIAKVDAKVGVLFEVRVTAMRFPQIFREEDGSYAIEESLVPLELMTINADIDGVSYTTNDGIIKLSKGIHYLKIHHKDLEPIEKTINVTGEAGQKFVYEGILTEDAKRRLQADMDWMQKTVEKYKASINQDKIREIDLRRREIQAHSEAVDAEIKIKVAEAKIRELDASTADRSKLADAEVRRSDAGTRAIDSDAADRSKLAEAGARKIDAAARAIVNMSKAELERAKGIYEALKNSGFKIKANLNID